MNNNDIIAFRIKESSRRIENVLNDWVNGEKTHQEVEDSIKDNDLFLVPVYDVKKDENGNSSINFIFADLNDGVYVLMFSSEEELRKEMDGCKFIILSFGEIIALIRNKQELGGILLNSFTTPYRISNRLTGKSSKVIIGEPLEYPTALISMIIPLFEDDSNYIEKAWLSLIQQGEDDLSILIVLQGDYLENEINDAIRKRAVTMINDANVGLIICKDNSFFGEKVRDKYVPFWTKENGLNTNLMY